MASEQFPLLFHVIEEVCKDPDCEVHNVIVALEEGVISNVNLAYFLAGMQAAQRGDEVDKILEAYRKAALDGSLF